MLIWWLALIVCKIGRDPNQNTTNYLLSLSVNLEANLNYANSVVMQQTHITIALMQCQLESNQQTGAHSALHLGGSCSQSVYPLPKRCQLPTVDCDEILSSNEIAMSGTELILISAVRLASNCQ